MKKKHRILHGTKFYKIIKFKIEKQCLSVSPIQELDQYLIESVIAVFIKTGKTVKKIDIKSKIYINDINDIENIEYEPGLYAD